MSRRVAAVRRRRRQLENLTAGFTLTERGRNLLAYLDAGDAAMAIHAADPSLAVPEPFPAVPGADPSRP